ncbi:hypothetical protein [Streptomyces sp. NRRL S-448]|uniref:hypothetical protein n=1 Tax=Streptomyces sp. NRRL S-448 TaxID=1463907 RepID=UPI003561B3EA
MLLQVATGLTGGPAPCAKLRTARTARTSHLAFRCAPAAPAAADEGAHAMTLIAQEGDMLQTYDPWGSTIWVSEGNFINGYMGKACNSDLPHTYGVCLPR